MITLKQGVDAAMQFLIRAYGEERLKNLALEEVRLSEDESEWIVTLGFDTLGGVKQVRNTGSLGIGIGTTTLERIPRDLKRVRISAQTGEPAHEIVDAD
ncbi:MAG: hypothetical protein AAGH92_11895 [Planctomycetota bacterium]